MDKNYHNLLEAVEFLTDKTGLQWRKSDLLCLAKTNYLKLQGLPDGESPLDVKLFNSSNKLVRTEKLKWDKAIIDEKQINELLDVGQTYAEFGVGHNELVVDDSSDGFEPNNLSQFTFRRVKEFNPVVLIRPSMVLVPSEFLDKIIDNEISLPDNLEPAKKLESTLLTTNLKVIQVKKIRQNILDPAIDDAIKKAGETTVMRVWLELKEMALDGIAPFSGNVKEGSLHYTNSNDKPAELTIEALSKRLKRRFNP